MAYDVTTCLTLTEIEYEMREVTAADWFPLGVQLGIRPAKLREIEMDHPGDVWRCKFELMDWWHRNAKEVSWKALAHALEKTGRYGALAEKLRRKMPAKENLDSTVTPAQSVTTDENVYDKIKSDPPPVEQFQGLEVDEDKLMIETYNIRSKFNILFTKVRRVLMGKGVTVRDFVLFLRKMPGYPTKSLPSAEISTLCQSSDLIEVFETVSDYCSWFNHLFLGEVIDAYCSNDAEIRKAHQEFCTCLHRYCKHRVKKIPFKNGFGVNRKKGCVPMVLKVDREWKDIQLEQLDEVLLSLARILKVPRHALHLYSIENGCVQLTLTVPDYIPDVLFPLDTTNMVEIGVVDLQCGNYHFSQQPLMDAPSLLQRGLPRALPGLEEVTVESVKEGTQYESGKFQDPPRLPQGSGFEHITFEILSYIDDAQSLCRAERVCRDWYHVVGKGLLWKKLIEKKMKTDSMWRGLSERRGWRKYLFHHTPSEEVTHQFYKHLYANIVRDIDNLQVNWKSGDYTLTRIECHSKKGRGVWCLQYDDNKIVSGHSDSIIKIWDRKSLSVTAELQGHTDWVRCLQYDDRVIVTGSDDSTIRVWDVNDCSLLNRLVYHRGAVYSLRFNSDTLVTGSSDNTVAVWDMISPMDIFLRKVLKGHGGSVYAVDFGDKYIVSGSNDRTIKVWQTSTGEMVHTLHGHQGGIWCVQYRGKHIVSGSNDRTIRIWDIECGTCLRVLEGHKSYVRCIRFDDRRIVSGDWDGVIKVWDFQAALDPRSQAETLCLQTLREYSAMAWVCSLQFDDFQLISGSYDDSILIWDFLGPIPLGFKQTKAKKPFT